MALRKLPTVSFFLILLSLAQGAASDALKSVEYYQAKAKEFNSVLPLPTFETEPKELYYSIGQIIGYANATGDAIANQDLERVSFESTVGALDDLSNQIQLTVNRIYLMKETAVDEALRVAGTEAIKRFDEWSVGFNYREDIYKAVQAYADTQPELEGERAKLLTETVLDFKRLGLHLPLADRNELEELQKKLSALSTDFGSNIRNATAVLKFTKVELDGVSESFLKQDGVETGEDEFSISANITWHYITVMDNAKSAATREKLFNARYSLAKAENTPVLQQIVDLRREIASKLDYLSWFDFKTEVKMARNELAVREFVDDLIEGLDPKFKAENAIFQKMKAEDVGDPDVGFDLWDWRYYRNKYKKDQFSVDTEALRKYFPYEQCLNGMFAIYERIFGLKIEEVENPYKWQESVTLHVISDSQSGEPLGFFYLDMFPREGKYNHFASFGIIEGKLLDDGTYQRPVNALICNFPPPEGDKPSLLSYSEVTTLFHEFGHCMHSLLTRAKFVRFSGTSVPRDFVEAPSQMLEYWLESKAVLDTFAANYQDPEDKIDGALIDQIVAAEKATIGGHYRRQLTFCSIDLKLHGPSVDGEPINVVEDTNAVFDEVLFPVPEDTSFVTYFGHMTGYDGGYYGYAWADAIAADMATVFEEAPDGYLDVETGLRLRHEIYETGGSRDMDVSIRAFLGRERSLKPFLKNLGIETE